MSEFKYVPVEPTEGMLAAACDAEHLPIPMWERMKKVYTDMLAAAPEQPSPAKSYNEDQKDDDRIPLDRLADHISESWPDKKFGLDEICQRLNAMWPAEFMPSPAESDKEAVRNAALEEAAAALENHDYSGYEHFGADDIRALKSQPAQLSGNPGELPSDSQAEVSDRLNLILTEFPIFSEIGLTETEHCCEWSILQDRKRLHSIIKAAMRAEREGK